MGDNENKDVPEANLSDLSGFSQDQDISRLEARVEETIGLASDGRP